VKDEVKRFLEEGKYIRNIEELLKVDKKLDKGSEISIL
jgi:transposase-like protein